MKYLSDLRFLGWVVAVGLGSPRAPCQSDATLRLGIVPATPGGSTRVTFAAPFPNGTVRLQALSPTGEDFQVGAFPTDETGRGETSISLRNDPTLGGVNGIFYAELEAPGGRVIRSDRVFARFPIADEPGIEAPVLLLDDAPVAPELSLGAALLVDVDSDEDLDLLGSDSATGGSLRLFANDGTGSFSEETSARLALTGVVGARVLAAADLTGDGSVDIFVGTEAAQEENFLLLGDSGRFTVAKPLTKGGVGVRTNDAVLADLDADGDVDLFVANGISGSHGTPASPQANLLFLNDGFGELSTVEILQNVDLEPSVSRSVSTGDVDGDGDLDLLVGNAGTNFLLLNDGKAAFTDASRNLPEAADSTYAVALTDVDLDLDLDIVYAGSMFDPLAQVLLLNQGGAQAGTEGVFIDVGFPPLVSGQSPIRLGLEVADIDADGDPDLIFSTHELGNNETPDLYLNQGGAQHGEAGSFVRAVEFPVPTGVYSMLPVGDVDGDGDLDILVPGADVRLLRSQVFLGNNSPLAFRRGDVNQDGVHDLSDPIALLGHLFLGAPAPGCMLSADVNDSGVVDLSDAVALLSHLFLGTAAPPAPFPGFGDAGSKPLGSCGRVEVFTSVGH